MNEHYTELVVILDRSGSMEATKQAAMEGFDAFVKQQMEVPGDCVMTLVRFDTIYEKVFEQRPLSKVPKLKLEPRGGTALHDAIGKTINDVRNRHAEQGAAKKPAQVIVLIVTDGEENSSMEFPARRIKAMIKEAQRKDDWKFIYLGSNQDAIVAAQGMGIERGQTMAYSGDDGGTQAVYNVMSASTKQYRMGARSVDFTDEQRARAAGNS